MNKEPESDRQSPSLRESAYHEFVGLITRHDQAIRRFVRSLLYSRDGVDDVMQETALECWKKFPDFTQASTQDAADEFVRWACVIARFKAMSWQRDRARDRLVFRESVIEQLAQVAMENLDQQGSERHAIQSCLAKMQDDQRRLLMSVYSRGDSIAQVAVETGERARRLYSRVNVLRKTLLDCVHRQLTEDAQRV